MYCGTKKQASNYESDSSSACLPTNTLARAQAAREKTRWRTAKEDAEKLKTEHKFVNDKVRDLDGKFRRLKAHNEKVRIELMLQLEILHQPARQKKTLKKIVTALSRGTTILEKEIRKGTKEGFDDVYSRGEQNLR